MHVTELKEIHERWVGDEFIAWLNEETGKQYRFSGQPDRAPDLTYRSDQETLHLEVATGYYDAADATFKWKNARGLPDAPHSWQGVDSTTKLVGNLSTILTDKCSKAYGEPCILVLYVDPRTTEAEYFEQRKGEIELPLEIPFVSIYLMGDFGQSSRSMGGRRIWKLHERQ